MKQEELNEIVENHVKWLYGNGGKPANLMRADLHGADLSGANLKCARLYKADLRLANLRDTYLYDADLTEANLHGVDLSKANLTKASLYQADLSNANLSEAILSEADLRETNLSGTDLSDTNLSGADLPTGMYQIVGPGSYNRCTTYDSVNDQVVCGCWDDKKGNHLDSFIIRVERIYGPNGKRPDPLFYAEYMAAIDFFKAMKKLNKRT